MGRMMAYSSHSSQASLFALRNNVRSGPRNIQRMAQSSSSSATVVTNIQELKRARGWSNRDLARQSKVSDRMIGKILNNESEPTTATLDKIAKAFGIESWQLLVPGIRAELFGDDHFGRVFHAYIETDDEGRRVMESQAEYIARTKKGAGNDPNGHPDTKGSAG